MNISIACEICNTNFDADEYDDTNINKCPECGQIYNYDEGLTMVLSKDQMEWLRELKGYPINIQLQSEE